MSLTPFHDFNFIPSIPRSMFDMDLWHRPIGMDLMRRRLDFGPSTLGNWQYIILRNILIVIISI
jgi:hypothetical protein